MPARSVCSYSGCPELVASGRCPTHRKPNRSGTREGYNTAGHREFRRLVLLKHPHCQVCRRRPATNADHWPIPRLELVARGMDPNCADHGRGLCHGCHSRHTRLSAPRKTPKTARG